jgi:hypothetical protein
MMCGARKPPTADDCSWPMCALGVDGEVASRMV